MIKIKHLVLAAALFVGIVPLKIEAKHVVVPKMYMFGFAASFNDTIVHFTNVIEVDSVWMESKKQIPPGTKLLFLSITFLSFNERESSGKNLCNTVC